LAGLTALEDLDLSHNLISDISPLKELTGLKYLSLHNNPLSERDIKELKKALPNTEIYY